jgi:hypothetical protein
MAPAKKLAQIESMQLFIHPEAVSLNRRAVGLAQFLSGRSSDLLPTLPFERRILSP